ncbi:MAG: hypothetical protein Q9163_002653 [Psora crenata]
MDDTSPRSSHDGSPTKELRGLSFAFLKTKPKTTKEGLPAKKRGPKRDAKPAISRRQELNRQAQSRTHRERKEYYTKSLEMEVARMRETFTHVVNEKQRYQRRAYKAEQQLKDANIEAMKHENERLKQLLQVNGITYDRLVPVATGLPTPTQLEPHAFGEIQPNPLGIQHPPSRIQQPSGSGHHHSFNNHQTSFPGSAMSTHTVLGQQTGVSRTASSPKLDQAMSNGTTTMSPSALTSFSQPASITETAYPSDLPSPLGSAKQTSHSHAAPWNCPPPSLETSNPAGAMMSDASTFQEGRSVRNKSDERIQQQDINHDQLGVEFVLALEENCRDHQQFLTLRANPPAGEDLTYELSGHALMLTNPPPSHIATSPETPYHQPPNIPLNNLMQLLETAQRLPLTGGEITPVLALRLIREDERYGLLTKRQFEMLTERLRHTSRCYGFGAVLEEFEVRDAIDAVFRSYAPMDT